MSEQRPIYPPFNDDDDWLGIEAPPPGGTHARARELVIGASAAHHERHTGHDHPWCSRCETRSDVEQREVDGLAQLVSPETLTQRLDDAGLSPDDPEILKARKLWDSGYIWNRESLADTNGVGLDPSVVDVVHDYLDGLEDWEALEQTSRRIPLARASRYLLLHQRQPADPWPALPVPDELDSAYLSRARLGDLPVADPLIERTIPRNAYTILRGRDGTYKSFVALDWSLCLATGQTWQGQPSEATRVLYIAGEGAYGLAKRVDAWEAARGVRVDDEAFVVRTSALSLFKPSAAFDHLLDVVAGGGFGLVVVDTLRRVSGSADGNGSDMGTVIDNLDRIKRATDNGSVLVLAHTGKDDNDSRGFSGIEDDADVVWHAKREEMNLELTCAKFKDGPDGHTFNLHATTEGESLVLTEAGEFVTVASESQIKLLDTMRTVFPDGAHSTQLMDASGLPKTTFHRVRAELQNAGHIINTGTRPRPFYELVQSHEVPPTGTPSDLHESHEVPPGPTVSGGSPTGPTPFKGGTWDHDGTEPKNNGEAAAS